MCAMCVSGRQTNLQESGTEGVMRAGFKKSGKKVSELPNRSGITWPYSPESAKEVLNTLWLEAGGSFDG